MVGGVAFDPAEFAAFKSGLAAPGGARDAGPAPVAAPVADAFDPAEFASFKASRQAPASFSDRFDAAPPMSRAEAAPRSGPDRLPGIGQDQKAADALFSGVRAKADEELIGKPSAANTATTALFGAGQGASLNLAGNAAAGVATGLGMLEGAGVPGISGYGDGKRTFAENYYRFRDLQGAYERQNPKTAVASELAGAVAATPLMPGLPVAEGANIAARATRYGLTGAGYGAAAAAIGTHDPVKALEGAGYGAAGGAILGPIVEKVAPPVIAATSKALEPILARFGRGAVATETGFTPRARAVLINAGLDADRLPPELAQHIETTFAAKGETPAALREAQAAEFGLPLSRGQATQDPRALAEEGRALAGQSGPRAQAIGEEFGTRQADALAGARDRFQGMAAGSFDTIENPQAAYEAVADRARQAAQAEAERVSVAQRGVDDALRIVRGRGGTDALDGASAAAQGVRDAAAQGRARYRAAYDEVAQIPGTFAPGALDRLGARVRDRLGADVPLDPVLTPAATRAIGDLDALPGLFNLQPGEGPNLQQLDQVRKRLVAYRGTTGQNPTDRRAVDRIIAELDNHAQDAMSVGLFGPQKGGRATDLAGDGFPGFAASPAAPDALPAGWAPAGKSEPLTHYLARNGGIRLDDDARAADLGRVMTPYGPLGRRAGRPIEDFRDQLASEGFLRPDSADGMISRRIGDEVHDLISLERSGQPVYRLSDLSRGGAPADAGGRLADQSAAYAERVAPFRQQVVDDLASVGVHPRDMDAGRLDDAAQRLFRGEHDTGADAYEAAVLSRDAMGAGRGPAQAPDAIPFEGATAQAASDALPIGDTAPLEAMQRARGLFRDYRQAFTSRGPGDAAGRNLERIAREDASPNEVAAMLFGSPGSGRVQSGQLQTLSRLRNAVGADSEPWSAVQRGLIARHLGGEGRDLGQRLDYLLRGEGRSLLPYLTEEQRNGLGRLRGAVYQAEGARTAAPSWASDLERTGFEPNAVARSIFGGSGALGAKPGAANEAQAAKAFLGADSAEWAGLRQAAVQRLLDPATPATKMIAGLRDFTDGAGKGVATTLFNADELGHLKRFAGALQATVRPDGTIKPGAAGEAGRKAVSKAMDLIAGAIAFKVGGLGAAAGTYGAKVGTRAIMGGLGAASARRSFEGGAPRLVLPPPDYAVSAGAATGRVLETLGAGY